MASKVIWALIDLTSGAPVASFRTRAAAVKAAKKYNAAKRAEYRRYKAFNRKAWLTGPHADIAAADKMYARLGKMWKGKWYLPQLRVAPVPAPGTMTLA